MRGLLGIITEIHEDDVHVLFDVTSMYNGFLGGKSTGIWPKELFLSAKVSLEIGEEFFVNLDEPDKEFEDGFMVHLNNDGRPPDKTLKQKPLFCTIVRIVDAKSGSRRKQK